MCYVIKINRQLVTRIGHNHLYDESNGNDDNVSIVREHTKF